MADETRSARAQDRPTGAKCHLWLAALSTAVLLALPATAQETATRLEAENRLLRAEVAELRAELAALRQSPVCTAGEPGQGAVPLLRKLARAEREAALIGLGLAPGPLRIPEDVLGGFVPSEYILLTDGPAPATPQAVASAYGIAPDQVLQIYGPALDGFAARLTVAEADRLRGAGGIAGVVRNGYVFASGAGTAPPRDTTPKAAPQPVAGEGTSPPLDVYLFDTGIRSAHRDLDGRVAPDGFSSFRNGLGPEDCAGHGTHVAARIAGHTLGQTEQARLVSVKVMDRFGAGDVATVIAGIDWVLRSHDGPVPALVNMSLTRRATETPSPLDMAVTALIDAGAVVVVAAGNAASDVADFTPARVSGAVTVGSVGPAGLSHFSNAGTGVDLYTGGEGALSASIRDVCALREMSGTSMAAPVVTGLIANFLASGMTPEAALSALRRMAEPRPTGARRGETTRLVLPTSPLGPGSLLCPDTARIIYDAGLAE